MSAVAIDDKLDIGYAPLGHSYICLGTRGPSRGPELLISQEVPWFRSYLPSLCVMHLKLLKKNERLKALEVNDPEYRRGKSGPVVEGNGC